VKYIINIDNELPISKSFMRVINHFSKDIKYWPMTLCICTI